LEQFLLIIAFAAIALIAISQCAHHSARCHKVVDISLIKRKRADSVGAWGHTAAGSERSQEPTAALDADRESRSK